MKNLQISTMVLLAVMAILLPLIAPFDTSTTQQRGLSSIQRPRKPHRYVKQQNSTSTLAMAAHSMHHHPPSMVITADLPSQTLSDLPSHTMDHHDFQPTTAHQNVKWSGNNPMQIVRAMTCLMAMRWNRNIRRIVTEIDQLFHDTAMCSQELMKTNKQYHKYVDLVRKMSLLMKMKRKSEDKSVSSTMRKEGLVTTPLTALTISTILHNDIQMIANKQFEYIQALEEQVKDREIINKQLVTENKELRGSLYRTDVALRESTHEKDQLESKVSILTLQQQQYQQIQKEQDEKQARREYDVSTIHYINSCILIASRAQKYETYTDEIIERLEGQLRNVSLQLSRYQTTDLSGNDNNTTNR